MRLTKLGFMLLGLTVTACESPVPQGPSPSAQDPVAQPEQAPPPAEAPKPEAPQPTPHFIVSGVTDTTADGKGEGPYKFTTRWHTQVIDTWTQQLAAFRGKPNLHYLEIGAFEGRSIIWMLENILTDPSSRVTAIDVFMPEYEPTFDANMAASGAGDRITKLVGPSQARLRPLEPNSFDIIYVDGSHTADDVLADAVLAWPLLREGGLMIFDDYDWTGRTNASPLPLELLPLMAIDAFITAYRNEIDVLHHDYQVIVRRKPNPCVPKDYCSPIGQYNYFWRSFELRRRSDDTLIELSDAERQLIELIAKSKRIGQVAFDLDPRFVASPEYVALTKRLELEL